MCKRDIVVSKAEEIDAPGRTRKLIGATLEGQTKDSDGQAFADVNVEHLSTEVRQPVAMHKGAS